MLHNLRHRWSHGGYSWQVYLIINILTISIVTIIAMGRHNIMQLKYWLPLPMCVPHILKKERIEIRLSCTCNTERGYHFSLILLTTSLRRINQDRIIPKYVMYMRWIMSAMSEHVSVGWKDLLVITLFITLSPLAKIF